MTFTLDTTSIGAGAGNPVTVAHTCSSGTKVLVVFVFVDGDTARTGGVPSYNSASMTDSGEGSVEIFAGGGCTGGKAIGEIFFLPDPSTGSSYDVSVPNTGSASLHIHVASFKASGTVSKNASNSGCNAGTNPSIDVVTTVNNCLMVGALVHDANSPSNSPGTNYTEIYLTDWGPEYVASEYDLDTGSSGTIAVDWSESASDDWGAIGLALEEAAGGGISIPVVQHHRQQQLVGN